MDEASEIIYDEEDLHNASHQNILIKENHAHEGLPKENLLAGESQVDVAHVGPEFSDNDHEIYSERKSKFDLPKTVRGEETSVNNLKSGQKHRSLNTAMQNSDKEKSLPEL